MWMLRWPMRRDAPDDIWRAGLDAHSAVTGPLLSRHWTQCGCATRWLRWRLLILLRRPLFPVELRGIWMLSGLIFRGIE